MWLHGLPSLIATAPDTGSVPSRGHFTFYHEKNTPGTLSSHDDAYLHLHA